MDKIERVQQIDAVSLIQIQRLVSRLTLDDYVALVLIFIGAATYLSHGKLWAKPDPFLYKLYERPQEGSGPTTLDESSKDIAAQLEKHEKDLVIFWGSQSGTAEGLAHRLARDCKGRFGLNVIVADLSDYEPDSITKIPSTKFALFLISTYGEGDPSDNTTEFLEWLNKKTDAFQSLRYAAFGLGNSNYVYYNKVIDEVVERLDRFGARSLLPVGKADDANSGTEEDFASWRDDLFAMFHTTLGLEERATEYTPSIQLTEITGQIDSLPEVGVPKALKLSRKAAREHSAIQQLPLKEVRKITNSTSTGRECLHFEVDIRAHPQMKYKTGDHLAIWPTNASDEVKRLVRVLGLAGKEQTQILVNTTDPNEDFKVPIHSTISALFEHYLEIGGSVSRDTVTALAQFAPTATTKAFLLNLSNKPAYSAFIARNHVTFARLLEHTLLEDANARWLHLPLPFVIESLRPMSPRYYSISSSSMVSPRQLSITVAISPSKLAENPAVAIPGLTTSYLSSLDINATATTYAHIRRSTFKMPFLHKTPIVLVAAGTGIAPFRGFLHERAQMAQVSNQDIGKVLLVFGCRHPDDDYLYREEIERLQNGPLKGKLEVVTAFSRVSGQPKVYVQDRLSEPRIKEQVIQILCRDEGNLYFCGSTTMAKTAGRTLVDAVGEQQGHDDAAGKAWMDGMKRSKRWQEDVWG